MFCVPLGLQPMMNNWVFPRSTALFAGSAKYLTKRVFFFKEGTFILSVVNIELQSSVALAILGVV
jgi:hypothetical protein